MSKFSRLFDLASKAVDKATSNNGSTTGSNGGSDWRALASRAAESLGSRSESSRLTPPAPTSSAADRAAIARYDYLMQTASPHEVEQIHREAFERLTPAQRAQVEQRMRADLPTHEQPLSSSPHDLARAAGRSEAARPGRMRGILARVGGGAAAGAGIGLLGAVAGGAILSTVAAPLLASAADLGVDFTSLADGVQLPDLASEQIGGFEVPGLKDFFG